MDFTSAIIKLNLYYYQDSDCAYIVFEDDDFELFSSLNLFMFSNVYSVNDATKISFSEIKRKLNIEVFNSGFHQIVSEWITFGGTSDNLAMFKMAVS